jgi:nitronate monooxygenase
MWPDRRLLDLFDIELPIVQAPMAGAVGIELIVAAAEAGALGSLPCAMLTPDQAREQIAIFKQRTSRPLNVNFFCHTPVAADAQAEARWRTRLADYYKEYALDPNMPVPNASRSPFDEAMCQVIEEAKPKIVSFHFGLPEAKLLRRVKAVGCIVLSSATTVKEARWLEAHGADVIIAQGNEAGGHRGMFLTDRVDQQPGTFALVPQVVDAVRLPVIAAGGISDGRGIAAAFALGASAAQVGSAYLKSPESLIGKPYRDGLATSDADSTAVTNLMTGKPARSIVNRVMAEVGPLSSDAPAFPHAATALAPLRAAAEKKGSGAFTPMWSGQAASLAPELPAAELTRKLAADALKCLKKMAS